MRGPGNFSRLLKIKRGEVHRSAGIRRVAASNIHRHYGKGGRAMAETRTILKFVLCFALVLALASCAGTRTKESTGEYFDDSAITAKVKADLVADPVTKAHAISVETFKGVVQPSGFVATAKEKERAGEVASKVKGVVSVKNNIVLK